MSGAIDRFPLGLPRRGGCSAAARPQESLGRRTAFPGEPEQLLGPARAHEPAWCKAGTAGMNEREGDFS